MFRGRFEHTIDDKGRLAIPAKFRQDVLGDSDEGSVIVTNFDRCLSAYPLREWEALETKLASLPQFDPKVVAFQRYFISGATECPIDKAGRILIPQNLRQLAGIERDCIIAGQLKKFEIWSAENWQREFACIADQFGGITETMSGFGVTL